VVKALGPEGQWKYFWDLARKLSANEDTCTFWRRTRAQI